MLIISVNWFIAGCWSACVLRCSRCAGLFARAVQWLGGRLNVRCWAGRWPCSACQHAVIWVAVALRSHPLQGVPAEQVLVLTFSRRAQSEFAARLQQRVPDAEQATVSTFHAWAWQLVRRHWREAGFARQPTVAAAEEQLVSVMRDCLT